MDIDAAVDGEAFVFGQHFGPAFAVVIETPVVGVKAPPQQGAARFVQELFGYRVLRNGSYEL